MPSVFILISTRKFVLRSFIIIGWFLGNDGSRWRHQNQSHEIVGLRKGKLNSKRWISFFRTCSERTAHVVKYKTPHRFLSQQSTLNVSTGILSLFFVSIFSLSQELSMCPVTANKIMLSLILRDHNWDEIIASKCDRALNKLSKCFGVPKVWLTFKVTGLVRRGRFYLFIYSCCPWHLQECLVATNVNARDLAMMSRNALRQGDNQLNNRKRSGKVEFVVSLSYTFIPQMAFTCSALRLDRVQWWIFHNGSDDCQSNCRTNGRRVGHQRNFGITVWLVDHLE